MIVLSHVWKAFGAKSVLEDVSLQIQDGTHLAIVGASGSGKSVLTRLILGLESPDQGDISMEGKSLQEMSPADWRARLRDVGVVFQGAALFDSLTVLENVGLRLFEDREMPPAAIRQAVVEALEQVRLDPNILEQYPAQLSGGMRKRVGIARAIIHQPRYLIFDEPTTGLDPLTADAIDELIEQLAARPGRSTLIVTHDMDSVRRLSSWVVMIRDRHICFDGPQEAFFRANDSHIQAFLARGRDK
ncbi:MAG: ATP-binding cassette domain-containing protein [Bacteroidetes bacterium]|nr:MAG: ATP-binding cassette domain-containing protein [Bacteroidota bacterium]